MVGESWIKDSSKKESSPNAPEKHVFFEKASEANKQKGIDVLLFGDSNTGKTYVSSTFPEPIYIIDTEGRAAKTAIHFKGKDIRVFNPMEIRLDFRNEGEMEEAIDFEKSIDNITNCLIDLTNKIKNGEIKNGTIVIDSMSDLWTWIQEWGKIRLAKKQKIDLIELRVKNQFDWGLMTSKHYKLIAVLRKLLDYNINIVGTARESNPPDYVQKPKNTNFVTRIRSQKDVPFWFSTIINLKIKPFKTSEGTQKKYIAKIEKLETLEIKEDQVEKINYEKIKKMIQEKTKSLEDRQ